MARPAHKSRTDALRENSADPLTLELLAWIDQHSATYAEVLEVWRTHCPRHAAWEDAVTAGMIETTGKVVRLTPYGARVLRSAARARE